MNSPFATIFLSLQQRIHAEVPAITYIDQELGQLSSKMRPPVSWPCVLIDFEDFRFDNLGENVQTATGSVVLRLGFEPHSNSSQSTPLPYIQQAIAYYDIEWALHKTIQGWSPASNLGSFSRISTATQTRTDNYRVREIRYSIAFEDYSTKHEQMFAPATLIISEEITGN